MRDTASVCLRQEETSEATRPLRIALFTETFLPRSDGSIRRVCQTVLHLRDFGHEVLVIAPDGGIRDFGGARIHGVPGFSFPLYPEVKLAIPRPAIGKALAAFRPDLIGGVEIETGAIHPDDRGFFTELFRLGASPMTKALPHSETLQLSAALSYPGIIKAIHYHFEQTDYWAPVRGMLQVVLWDLREGSITQGAVNTLYMGELRPWRLKIPPGVGHGYKVIGEAPAVLVYLTDRFYNPRDEGRLDHNHPFLNYDWELQHK